jgi:predicted RNase H-like nuclease
MQAVLGIDAAWTEKEPSGVALVAKTETGWRLYAVSPSYHSFYARAAREVQSISRPSGSRPDAAALLASSLKLCGRPVDLVAVDMPLAHSKIKKRRFSDNEVSRAYGARKCGTHSPSGIRPGPISDALNKGFAKAGYPLLTNSISPPGLIEAYPHPALVELAHAEERLRYKVSKIGRYWPDCTVAERKVFLFKEWARIVLWLDAEIAGISKALPPLLPAVPGIQLKAYEDMLDATICAWIGICALEGRAKPFGDQDSAIWIPKSSRLSPPVISS